MAGKFADCDTVIIGISTDTVAVQRKFIDKEKLTFPLFGDSDKTGAKAFGVLGKSGYASRVTFVIDKKGTIRKVYSTVKPAGHPAEVLKFVKENLKG